MGDSDRQQAQRGETAGGRTGGADDVCPSGPPILRAPWRDQYMQTLAAARLAGKPADLTASAQGEAEPVVDAASFLGAYWLMPEKDGVNHVIVRLGEGAVGGMVLLNRYPYANGHLLVALAEARPRLMEYEPAQRAAFWALVEIGAALMDQAIAPQGINIGVNEGEAAGAGVPQHLHAHIVPRWLGDVNFITVAGNIRVIPSALDDMAQRYRHAWDEMRSGQAPSMQRP